MKKLFLTFLVAGASSMGVEAATSINLVNKFAYGANFGWIDWRGDVANGAVIGEYVCSGFLYGANVGWINLGNGAPLNGIRYQNLAANDFGVNHDGLGNLRGLGYGANIGWINFENTGAAKIDFLTGRLTGYAYSANCGWISLSNASAYVQTDFIAPAADSDGNGLPDPWELANFGATGQDPDADPDNDGMSNDAEELAGTDPNNGDSKLIITEITAGLLGTPVDVTWDSVLTRLYYLQTRLDLGPAGLWVDSGLGLISPDGISTVRNLIDPSEPMRFYRVEAVKPLPPP